MAKSRSKPSASADTPARGVPTVYFLLGTAILLALIFPPFYCFFLAPICLAPLGICILRRPMNLRHLVYYYLAGATFFVPNLYWLAPVTIPGFILLALFLSLYFPLFAFTFHRLTEGLRVPATLSLPIAWTAVEFARSTFLEGGFPWFMLGNSFAPAPVLIQIADLGGVWCVTFFIALLNGLVVDLLRLPLRRQNAFNPLLFRVIAAGTLVSAFTIGYGIYRLGENTITPGPRVAVIQDNIPQTLKESGTANQKIFEEHFQLSMQAASADPRPDLIAWPETMVPGFINSELINAPDSALERVEAPQRDYFKYKRDEGRDYMELLSKLSNHFQVPLLLGTGSIELRTNFNDSPKQNRTLLLLPAQSGTATVADSYAKVHLVPFGEYIPFRNLPVVGKYMIYISPLKAFGKSLDYSNIPGTRWTRFQLAVREPRMRPGSQPATATAPSNETITTRTRVYTFGTPICFEDTMPDPARKMTAPQFAEHGSNRKTDFLINVSNDGWFFSVELNQRLQASQLRAVENRVPIARAVNTGNSGLVDSCGRIRKLVTDEHRNSIGAVGTAAFAMPLDSRVTLFSRIGDLFPIVCGVAGVLGVAWTLVRPRRDH